MVLAQFGNAEDDVATAAVAPVGASQKKMLSAAGGTIAKGAAFVALALFFGRVVVPAVVRRVRRYR